MNKEQVLLFASFAFSLLALLLVVFLLADKMNVFSPRVEVKEVVKEIVVTPTVEVTATPSAVIRTNKLPSKAVVSPAK